MKGANDGTNQNHRKKQKNGTIYRVIADGAYTFDDKSCITDDSIEGVTCFKNDEPMQHFGCTWAGASRDEFDFANSVVTTYLNGDAAIDIIKVTDNLKKIKEKFLEYQKGLDVKIPKHIITPSIKILDLIGVFDCNVNHEAVYADNDSQLILVEVLDGKISVLTDIEAFTISGIVMDFKDGNELIYVRDDVKEWFDEIKQQADT